MPAESQSDRPLFVPFVDKDVAKSLGAIFSFADRRWHVPADQSREPFTRWDLPSLEGFPGEDRAFDRQFGSGLYPDLIPASSWNRNVRSLVDPVDWERIKHYVVDRAGHSCECCSSKITPLHTHERWQYDEIDRVQTLRRLLALCPPCHEATHLGKAAIDGNEQAALDQLARVLKLNSQQVQALAQVAWERFERYSKIDWQIDIGIVEAANIRRTNANERTRESTSLTR